MDFFIYNFIILPVLIFIISIFIHRNRLKKEYSIGLDSQVPVIEFEQFKKFYNLNPERWKLLYDSVECIDEDSYVKIGPCDYTFKHYKFQFCGTDYKKYLKFYKEEKIRLMQEKVNPTSNYNKKDYIKFLNLMQTDIDNLKKQSEKEFNDVVELQEDAMKKSVNKQLHNSYNSTKHNSFCPVCNNLLIEMNSTKQCLVCGYSSCTTVNSN